MIAVEVEPIHNQQGSMLFLVVLMLALLSILGFSAMHTSRVDRLIATNELIHQKYFYTAEAGIAYGIKDLQGPFTAANADRRAAGIAATWDFVLAGAEIPADGEMEPIQGSYEHGVTWIVDAPLSDLRFSLRLWNNDETADGDGNTGGDARNDRDGRIWLRADATGPRGGAVAVQVLLDSDSRGIAVIDYPAQYGAGAGKNYNANDLDLIESFQPQWGGR
jgi:hypothetical protein